MKAWCLAVVVLSLAAGCLSTTGGHRLVDAERGGSLAGHRTVVLTVYGLSCPLCSNNLNGRLRRIEGVEDAIIDLKTGAVTVKFADGHHVTRGDIGKAVEDAGFTLKDIQLAGETP
jgi:copper chaperone CopZ